MVDTVGVVAAGEAGEAEEELSEEEKEPSKEKETPKSSDGGARQ